MAPSKFSGLERSNFGVSFVLGEMDSLCIYDCGQTFMDYRLVGTTLKSQTLNVLQLLPVLEDTQGETRGR